MRFGWMAAGAAVLVWAAPASAATWVRYEVEAFGTSQDLDASFNPVSPPQSKQIFASVNVLIDGFVFSAGRLFETDGIIYTARDGNLTLTVDGSRSGNVSARQSVAVNGGGGSSGYLSFTYPDNDTLGTLPTAYGTYTSSGSVGSQRFTLGNRTSVVTMGSIYKLTISAASDYRELSIDAVPEPASWAMLILGVGAIGGSLRRRRIAVAYG